MADASASLGWSARFLLSLRRLVDDGWTANLFSPAMLVADGIVTAPMPYEVVQTAAR